LKRATNRKRGGYPGGGFYGSANASAWLSQPHDSNSFPHRHTVRRHCRYWMQRSLQVVVCAALL